MDWKEQMSVLDALKKSTIPPRLGKRPRDKRGFPVPFTVLIKEDGTPDFRITDVEKLAICVQEHRCGLCGDKISGYYFFIGGPISYRTHLFTDVQMHQRCAEYALRVCPFLALTNSRYTEIQESEIIRSKILANNQQYKDIVKIESSGELMAPKPEVFMLGATKTIRTVKVNNPITGKIKWSVQAGPWISNVWWKNGSIIDIYAVEFQHIIARVLSMPSEEVMKIA